MTQNSEHYPKLSPSAKVIISYPSVAHPVPSPYSNVYGNIYTWNTYFREIGGYSGFELRAVEFYLLDPSGGRWTNSWSEAVNAGPGESVISDYWVSSGGEWAGGSYNAIWSGEDSKGNKMKIIQKITLSR